jgi:hypothetical protein
MPLNNEKHDRVQDLENLNKKELIQRVRKLEFELKGEEHLTKVDIIQRLREMEELGLEDEDLMNVEQEYNIGLKKSGWMKLYQYIKGQIQLNDQE